MNRRRGNDEERVGRHTHTTGLVVRAVRGGDQLTIVTIGREPGLHVRITTELTLTSRSYFFAAALFSSLETIATTRYGKPN